MNKINKENKNYVFWLFNIGLLVLSFLIGVYFNKNIVLEMLFRIGYYKLIDAQFQIILLFCQIIIITVVLRYLFKINNKIDKYFLAISYLIVLLMILFGRGTSGNFKIGLNPISFMFDMFKSKTNFLLSFLNSILFVPLPLILISFNKNISIKKQLITGIIVSFSIELIQLVFSLGTFDLSDITLYLFGLMIGLYFFNYYLKDVKLIK